MKIMVIIFPLIALFLPFWVLEFRAPIFGEKWLYLTIYGYGSVEGPLDQINIANHYVGLSEIDPASLIEIKFLPLLFLVITVFNCLIVYVRRKNVRKLLMYLLLLIIIMIPIYFQYWLYNFGHNISSEAAIKIEPFTPLVMGSYHIANFSAITYFHVGYWILVLSLIILLYIMKSEK
jgi:hypothetical protein